MDDSGAVLLRRFHQAGYQVDEAIEAYGGSSPIWGLTPKMPMTFQKWRLLSLHDGEIAVWIAWTGPTPRRVIGKYASSDLRILRPARWRYDRIAIGHRKLWTHRRDRDTVLRWIQLSKL